MKAKANQKEHSVLSNIFFFVKLMFKISPKLVIGELCYGFLDKVPTSLISVLGVKYIIEAITDKKDAKYIFIIGAIIAVTLILSRVIMYLFRMFVWSVEEEKLYYGLNKKLYEKAKSLDLESYDNPNFYNDFILTIESSSDNIQGLLNIVRWYFGSIMSLLSVSSVLLTIDPWCLVIIFAVVFAFLPLSRKIGNLQMNRRIDNTKFHRRADYFERVFYLQDYAKEVRMNNIAPVLVDRYNDAADDVVKNQIKYWDKISKLYCFQEIGVQVLGFMLVLPLYLGWLVLVKKTISAGDFVAVFNGAYSIATSVNFLTVWALSVFEERGKMIEKYRGFLKAESKITDGEIESECAAPEEIKIENLSFTYPSNSSPTLDDVSLTIKPYEKIALVGFNGAGKTTLTNLLLRLYDVSDGSIKIGGKDIRSSTVESHRNRFSAVFQDFQTFACTVGENVALSDEVDEARALDSLRHSGFTKPLKNGVNTELLREFDDDGVMLSGGETQKVAIARAFYKKCPYVILDEPSANLDPVAEYNLNRAMTEAAKDKTVIFISHRLSTTVNADRIYVMENGKIAEQGTHSDLMAKNGVYARMFNLQAEKYNK